MSLSNSVFLHHESEMVLSGEQVYRVISFRNGTLFSMHTSPSSSEKLKSDLAWGAAKLLLHLNFQDFTCPPVPSGMGPSQWPWPGKMDKENGWMVHLLFLFFFLAFPYSNLFHHLCCLSIGLVWSQIAFTSPFLSLSPLFYHVGPVSPLSFLDSGCLYFSALLLRNKYTIGFSLQCCL